MNKKETQQKEGGQSLVLVALAMVGLIAFAGLALDGGLAYATRRVAQNAADSGAIAGTYELHRQIWEEQFDVNQFDQNLILSKIHQVVESHDVPDTDGIPGNEINDNVRAFYVNRGAGSNSCSNAVQTDYEELCQLYPLPNPDNQCNFNDVVDRALGISIEVDVPFEPIFAGIIGWNEIEVSNRANDFDQRTAAVVNAEDTGFNSDLWAIFAMSQGTTSGPSTFIQVDPVFQPPAGFAFANVHSQGSFSVGNHPRPIQGQVTYCTTGGCENCFNAIEEPEQTQKNIDLPDFAHFAALAKQRAEEDQVVTGDTTWGAPIGSPIGPDSGHFIESGIWVINGDLTIDQDFLALGQYLFIYVTGDVTIDGFFSATDLSIISDGTITVNGTLKNSSPAARSLNEPGFENNVAVLWSSLQGDAINITGQISNPIPSIFSNNLSDIRGSIISENGNVYVGAIDINTTVRGSVIGNEVLIESDPDTGAQTRIQYNGNYFPVQPDRIELLK
jgi:hypothetical protein